MFVSRLKFFESFTQTNFEYVFKDRRAYDNLMKNREFILCLCLVSLSLVIPLNMFTTPAVSTAFIQAEQSLLPDYDSPAYLEILNDTAFETLNFDGDGSEAFPYLIKDYEIAEHSYTTGIKIYNTTKFCVITNCTIGLFNFGISLWDASNVTVTNNIVNYCPTGIVVNNCSDVEVVKNILSTCLGRAIYIYGSPSLIISDNTIVFSQFTGIGVFYSSECLINNNTLEYCSEGMVIYDCPGTIITNNNFTLGGIVLNSDDHQLEDYLSYIVENNTLNSEQIGFFKSVTRLDIDEDIYSQLILVNCTSFFVMKISFSDCITGLIAYFGRSLIVIDCTFTNNLEGSIVMFCVDSAVIDSAIISQSSIYPGGILLYECTSCIVRYSTITNCHIGIALRLSDNCGILENNIERSYYAGISIDESPDSLLDDNIINNTLNPDYGGILATNSYECHIQSNLIENNQGQGVLFVNTSDSFIHANLIRNNRLYGVYLDQDSSDTLIYKNEFTDNYLEGVPPEVNSQAWDSNGQNKWYSGSYKEGNYWNEHKQSTPYNIDGNAGVQDIYPLRKSPFKTNFLIPFLSLTIMLLVVSRIRKQRKR